ncbi:glycosidase, partial [Bacillus cereus]|nr:glycosidase [Bacillus cereus]
GVNAALNPGAIYHEGKYILVSRTEGLDRKSFFALAESDNGIDQFRFIDAPLVWEDIDPEETNMYDMRLVKHEDGWIYGI